MNMINMDRLLTKKAFIQKDKFWYDDPTILFKKERLDEFYPSRDMTLTEQLNSLVRLFIYISLLFAIFKQDVNYLFIIVAILVLTYAIYHYSDEKPLFNSFNLDKTTPDTDIVINKDIIEPTIDNPFMNVLLTDYTDNPERIAANSLNNYNNTKLNEKIDNTFYYNLYRDVDDVYDKYNSQRQFYTMPSTTIPNEQDKFVKWAYKTPPTCKEDNGYRCYGNLYFPLKDSKYRNQFYI
jgi:hypothetical protein